MSQYKRVVITGMGVISPLGLTVEDFWNSVCAGQCAIGPITSLRDIDSLGVKIAGEIKYFNPADHFDPKTIVLLDRVSQFSVVAARQAIESSGLCLTEEHARQTATIIGSGVGGMGSLDESFYRIYREGSTRVHPFTIPRLMVNACASHVSITFGLTGPTFTIASACASATHAIGQAFHMVRSGMVKAAITGGTEACITYGTMRGWEALRIMAPDTCRPFSQGRKGMVLSEGAACFVLENVEDAKRRNATILAEVIGFGMSADASDIMAPALDGMTQAMTGALEDSNITPDQVEYINAHGTGTLINDQVETHAIHRVFGDHASKLMVSSSKSMFGHALGGAGALELACTVLSLRHGVVLPTINYVTPDPNCDLDYVPNEARAVPIHTALSNSFAFGGLNAVLVVRKIDGTW